jgi:hypothetical protein
VVTHTYRRRAEEEEEDEEEESIEHRWRAAVSTPPLPCLAYMGQIMSVTEVLEPPDS